MFLATVALAFPLGKYIANVYSDKRTILDTIFNPLERLFYKTTGIDATREMTWKENLVALLTINLVWFFWGMLILMNQGWLPLNPDGNPSMTADLAFNTVISFIVNCNLQHYSGETGVSYFSQVFCLMFFQFVSAGTGMAAAAMIFKAMQARALETLGNFYALFVKSCLRILLPISLVVAVVLLIEGVPMTFEGKDAITTLQGDSVQVSRGQLAAFVPIKHVGTNGGGYFGANSAHPFESPSYITNITEMIAQMIIPIAMVFALGFFLNRKKLGYMIFGVMTIGFFIFLVPPFFYELQGNPHIATLGIDGTAGAMEGKEIRFGATASAYWSIATTVISTGSINAMHDSYMPLSGMSQLLAMMTNAFYGGVGAGILNFYIFIIIAVFISGMMVGRTPEFMGKKVEAKEMKIAMIIALLHPMLILAGTALANYTITNDPSSGWLNNPGFHGFSEMLYEFTSSAANNGSGFEGLADNNPFWNIATGIVLLLSRYLPIIGPVAIAGILARKKYIPESSGTLKTDTATFGIMILAVIFLVAALSFFPALALGPIAEHFSLY